MAYKLAEEDKLCGVIYPTYEGFSPIPKATCDMLAPKCDTTEIVVKCKDNQSEEDKNPESQSGSASASTSESTSESNSVSESSSESTSVSESTSDSTSTSESTSESQASTSESTSKSTSTESTSGSTSTESTSTSESTSVSDSTSTSESTSAESESTSESTTSTSESKSDSTSTSQSDSTSKSDSTSTSESTSTSDSKSDSTSTSTSDSTSVSSSTSTSNSTSESTTSVSNSQSESTLVSTSESKSESISASGSTSLSNSTSTSTSVSNSLSTTEPPSESELASTSLSEISSEEYVAHSNEISTIESSLTRATTILNSMLDEKIYVRRGNPYKPMYLKETVLNALSRANSVYADKMYLSENLTVNDVHIDPKYKMDSEHEPDRVPLVFDITLPWGGRRTMVVPTFVRYLDEDIEKPEPDEYLKPSEEEVPELPKEQYDDILNNTIFNFGIATFDGDTLISLRNTNGGELTKEDITEFEEYVSKTLENKLNEGRPESSKYKVKSKLIQNVQVGGFIPDGNDRSINIFRVSLKITFPKGYEDAKSSLVTVVIIDTL